MDSTKTTKTAWPFLLAGTGLTLTATAIALLTFGPATSHATGEAPLQAVRALHPVAAPVHEAQPETLDGTLEPDTIAVTEPAPPQAEAETADFEDLAPGSPVFIRPMLNAADTLDGNADATVAAQFEIAADRAPERDLADNRVAKTELPARLVYDLNTNWDIVQQVQYDVPSRRNSIRQVSSGNTADSGADQGDALKTQLDDTLKNNAKRGVSMAGNVPFDLMVLAQPYGADAMVFQPSGEPTRRNEPSKGSYIYSVGCLCWNYTCGGKTLLRSHNDRVFARVGNGYQSKPSQFLALLAMSGIVESYELKVDGSSYTIADLVESEKQSCRSGSNMGLTLTGLSFYTKAKDQWRNERREMWSLEKMVVSELNRSIDQGTADVTDWLLGLTSAVQRYAEDGTRFTPAMALAKKQLLTYHEFVLSIQNEQGLWHPNFFLYKGTSDDLYGTLYASGHILRFLAVSLSDRELNDPKVVKAVHALAARVNQVPQTANAVTLTDRQLEALSVSLQALAIYQSRVYDD